MTALRIQEYDDSLARGNQSDLSHIGNDIWLSALIDSPRVLSLNRKIYYRFLDRLYIPGKTTDLTTKQIVTVNRYRERTISSDPQYAYRDTIRRLLCNVIDELNCASVVELGPGQYPLPLRNVRRYSVVEIDPVAIERLRAAGVDVSTGRTMSNSFDICIGVFVFHFNISRHTLRLLSNSMSANGIFVFNVLTSMADVRSHAPSRLSRLGFPSLCIDLLPTYKKNDAIFICFKDSSYLTARNLHEKIIDKLENERGYDNASSVLVNPL